MGAGGRAVGIGSGASSRVDSVAWRLVATDGSAAGGGAVATPGNTDGGETAGGGTDDGATG